MLKERATCRPTVVVSCLQVLKRKCYALVCVEQSEDHRRVWRREQSASKLLTFTACELHPSLHEADT